MFPSNREIFIRELLEEELSVKPWKWRILEEQQRRSKSVWPGRGRTPAGTTNDLALLIDQPITETPELTNKDDYEIPSKPPHTVTTNGPIYRLEPSVPQSRSRSASPTKALKTDLPYATLNSKSYLM